MFEFEVTIKVVSSVMAKTEDEAMEKVWSDLNDGDYIRYMERLSIQQKDKDT